jgi:beta-mannosidase
MDLSNLNPPSRTRLRGEIALVFEGPYTFANVKLNGNTILQANNTFLTWLVDVTNIRSPDSDTIFEIDFVSALI